MKYILQLIFGAILILIGNSFVGEELRPELIGSGIIIILSLIIVDLLYAIYKNHKRLKLIIRCWILTRKNEYIRFSMAYLYRIKINDKYLLVKNSNWSHYQFIGGKYKRNMYTQKVLKDFDAIDDLRMPTHGLMKDDLAVFVPAKNAIKFIDWFNSKNDREISHWREFYEELIEGKATNILSQKTFPYVNYNYMGTVLTPLKRARGWDCWEILQYDILDLLPTPEQQKELENLYNDGDTDYMKWADETLINQLGYDGREKKNLYNIGEHTKWAINMKWSNE
jgi:hypothetical protein